MALCTVASVPPHSIFILSRTVSLRSWILASSPPALSSRMKVSRKRIALPLTLYTFSPCSFSIQKSSPMASSFSRIWYRRGGGPSWWWRKSPMVTIIAAEAAGRAARPG